MSDDDALAVRGVKLGLNLLGDVEEDVGGDIWGADVGHLHTFDVGDIEHRRDGVYECLDAEGTGLVADSGGVGRGGAGDSAARCEDGYVGKGGIKGSFCAWEELWERCKGGGEDRWEEARNSCELAVWEVHDWRDGDGRCK